MEVRKEDAGKGWVPPPPGEVRRGPPLQTPERPLLASPVPGEEKSPRILLCLPTRALPLPRERDRG